MLPLLVISLLTRARWNVSHIAPAALPMRRRVEPPRRRGIDRQSRPIRDIAFTIDDLNFGRAANVSVFYFVTDCRASCRPPTSQ